MWPRPESWLIALAVLLAGCSGQTSDQEGTISPGPGAETAVGAVEELIASINEPDFATASRMAIPGHAALAALSEGASFAEVAEALAEGNEEAAANFWAGFAQGAGDFLTGNVTATDEGTMSEGGLEFHVVEVQLADGGTRTILVRDEGGFRVDLFASFGAGLADKMIAPAERLLSTQTEEARMILAGLQEIVPSLFVAASLPGTTGGASQQLLALIEVITRVG
jgi:hypothetical protein